MSRLAVPVVSDEGLLSKVNDHFSMSDYYAILDVEDDRIAKVKVIRNPLSGQKNAADLLVKNRVNVVLAGRVGSCAIKILLDSGARIFSDAEGTLKDAFENYQAGKLREIVTAGYAL
jgi:predicted Fe-Mo cluster-binding NifX family protein